MKTLKEVIQALRTIDDGAADYIENNFNEKYFQKGISIRELNNPNPLGPLNFFTWDNYTKFRSFNDWRELNRKMKIIKKTTKEKTINLDNYTTKDIDFTGCNPVVAEAIKQNKSILCNAMDDPDYWVAKEKHIVNYIKELECPYITISEELYKYAEPIKKKKVRILVKGPVEVMEWLTCNKANELTQTGVSLDDGRFFSYAILKYCGKARPVIWDFPELLEKVTIDK